MQGLHKTVVRDNKDLLGKAVSEAVNTNTETELQKEEEEQELRKDKLTPVDKKEEPLVVGKDRKANADQNPTNESPLSENFQSMLTIDGSLLKYGDKGNSPAPSSTGSSIMSAGNTKSCLPPVEG